MRKCLFKLNAHNLNKQYEKKNQRKMNIKKELVKEERSNKRIHWSLRSHKSIYRQWSSWFSLKANPTSKDIVNNKQQQQQQQQHLQQRSRGGRKVIMEANNKNQCTH